MRQTAQAYRTLTALACIAGTAMGQVVCNTSTSSRFYTETNWELSITGGPFEVTNSFAYALAIAGAINPCAPCTGLLGDGEASQCDALGFARVEDAELCAEGAAEAIANIELVCPGTHARLDLLAQTTIDIGANQLVLVPLSAATVGGSLEFNTLSAFTISGDFSQGNPISSDPGAIAEADCTGRKIVWAETGLTGAASASYFIGRIITDSGTGVFGTDDGAGGQSGTISDSFPAGSYTLTHIDVAFCEEDLDADGDGRFNAGDAAAVQAAIGTPAAAAFLPDFDLDNDGTLDQDDADILDLLAESGASAGVLGDDDGDGDADCDDLPTVKTHTFDPAAAIGSAGYRVEFDADLDGDNDLADRAVIYQLIQPADLNADGFVNATDNNLYVVAFLAMDPVADRNNDGNWNATDNNIWVGEFLAACP